MGHLTRLVWKACLAFFGWSSAGNWGEKLAIINKVLIVLGQLL